MPQFLQGLMGYTAQKAGLVLSGAALVLLVEMPIVGLLGTKIQGRFLMAFGWAFVAMSMYISINQMNLTMSFGDATWLRVLQYAPMGFIFIPATTVAYIGLPKEKSDSIAGLINFMRNLGSSVGTSVVTTVLAQRSQFHQARLTEHTAISDPNYAAMLDGLSQGPKMTTGVGQLDANREGLAKVYQTVQAQASSLSYIDVFQILLIGSVLMFLITFLLKANKPGDEAPAAM